MGRPRKPKGTRVPKKKAAKTKITGKERQYARHVRRTAERDAEIRRTLREKGYKKEVIAELAECYGISEVYVKQIAPRWQIEGKPEKKAPVKKKQRDVLGRRAAYKGKKLTEENLKEIYERYQELAKSMMHSNAIKQLQKEYHMGAERLEDVISRAKYGF